jgi:hypothetical protein
MGRAKKIVAPPSGPTPAQAKVLRSQLTAVKTELQRLHLDAAADLVATSMLIAGLTQRLWALESLLAKDPNIALAMSRQAAAWGEQHVRAAKAMATDLLRELFAKAEAMERHQGQLKGLK